MNFLQAIGSNQKIKRSSWNTSWIAALPRWCIKKIDWTEIMEEFDITEDDILADDWEVVG